LRTAINLRAARPGDAKPNEQFVSDLYQKLSDQAASPVAPDAPGPVTTRRRSTAVATVAAAAVLVGGTVAATEAFRHAAPTPTIAQAPHGQVLRTGTFATPDSQILGQVVAYRGHPSWVFMNVAVPNYEGLIVCKLQVADGSTVAFGTFEVHHGVGQFSKILQVDVGRLRKLGAIKNPRIKIAILAMAAAANVGGVTVAVTAGGATPYSAGSTKSATRSPPTTLDRSGAATLHTATATVQGTTESILVDAQGRPLYIYKPDTATKSLVNGQLAVLWPPLVSAAPTARGATGTVATVATRNGQQVTYNGHFLYAFVQDSPGQVPGQGVQNFFVATPGISSKASTAANLGPAGNGY
jgi:predicted lipoprotein with Yx(FWY)xxD motif